MYLYRQLINESNPHQQQSYKGNGLTPTDQ